MTHKIDELKKYLVKEINFMCENLMYANANPDNFTFKLNLEWFVQLKQQQISRGFNKHCFKKENITKDDYSPYSVYIFNHPLLRLYLGKRFNNTD